MSIALWKQARLSFALWAKTMALLARLLQFLRFLDILLDFFEFLATPLGAISSVGVVLYGVLTFNGLASALSATLAGSATLALSCIITRPKF